MVVGTMLLNGVVVDETFFSSPSKADLIIQNVLGLFFKDLKKNAKAKIGLVCRLYMFKKHISAALMVNFSAGTFKMFVNYHDK